MKKPLVCFISYNRLGAAAANLEALLKTEDDFDLAIVDNASTDGIWEYIQQLRDERIKIKHQFKKNYGVVYAVNYGLSKREKYQPFIIIENDIFIDDKKWITKFEQTSKLFPELGLIGAVTHTYLNNRTIKYSDEEIKNILCNKNLNKMNMNFVPEMRDNTTVYYRSHIVGCCNYLTPQLLDLIGYWNEETCGADNEIGKRINIFTQYYTAVTGSFFVKPRPRLECSTCNSQKYCKYPRLTDSDCYYEYKKLQIHPEYAKNLPEKVAKFINDIKKGVRPLYSASIHDSESIINNYYDIDNAIKNFKFFSEYNKNSY